MSDEEVQYSMDETVLIARTIIIYILIAYNEMILNVLRLMLSQGIALCCIAALNLRYILAASCDIIRNSSLSTVHLFGGHLWPNSFFSENVYRLYLSCK